MKHRARIAVTDRLVEQRLALPFGLDVVGATWDPVHRAVVFEIADHRPEPNLPEVADGEQAPLIHAAVTRQPPVVWRFSWDFTRGDPA